MKGEHEIFGRGSFAPSDSSGPAPVLVVDDDLAWRRALERGLDLDGRRVLTVGSEADVAEAMARLGPCVVLTELSLGGSPIAGFSVAETALRANAPVGIVARCARAKVEQLRAIPFLAKRDVNRASLRALVRYLERAL
jgi:DNA-binding NtrC family response regulator